MDEATLIKAIIALGVAVASMWGSYIALQSAKDKERIKVEDKAEEKAEKQQKRFDDRIVNERARCTEEKGLIIDKYERESNILKKFSCLNAPLCDDNRLDGTFDDLIQKKVNESHHLSKEETNKIQKEFDEMKSNNDRKKKKKKDQSSS